MEKEFQKITFDLFCEWKNNPPAYRLYVNHELFNERTYAYSGTQYLREILQLSAPPGHYRIRIEPLGKGEFRIRNLKCVQGDVVLLDNCSFEIHPK